MKNARPAPRSDLELRCDCGSLLARLVLAGLELKCRRCKRVLTLPLDAVSEDWIEVSMR